MNAALKLMTPDAFLEWCLAQEDRWELVNGMPVRMMTGATQRHDMVVVNVIADLKQHLRGKPCRPSTADVAALIPNGNVRRPDATVDCGPVEAMSLSSSGPTVFFEVLSPSTRAIDLVRKADEYKTVPSLRHIVLIDPNVARVGVWSRADEPTPWTSVEVVGVDGQVELPAIDVVLAMAAIYDGMVFEAD